MNTGLSEQVRAVARVKYVDPAIRSGKRQFSIPVRDLLEELAGDGFPLRNTPQVCTALQTAKFLRENGLEIEGVDGPPSGLSTTVVVRYRVTENVAQGAKEKKPAAGPHPDLSIETPSAHALRLTEKLRGLLKEELAEYGGGEAFLRWIRSEDEDAA